MKLYDVVLYGTITRNIIRRQVEATSSNDARRKCERDFPNFTIRSIMPTLKKGEPSE